MLLLLIRAGADVSARRGDNISVSDLAYINRSVLHYGSSGSYTGDLWDSVLSELGYDLAEFRAGYPRRAEYNKVYTRNHFEMLWDGREEFCPYYDDPPVWSVERGAIFEEIAREGTSSTNERGISEGATREGRLDSNHEETYYDNYLDSYFDNDNSAVGEVSEENHT